MTDWAVQSVIFCTCLIQSAKVGHFCVSIGILRLFAYIYN